MKTLLLDVWREAGRHAELDETAERLAERLAAEMPVRVLLVRRLDAERLRLETVAAGAPGAAPPAGVRTELSAAPRAAWPASSPPARRGTRCWPARCWTATG